MSDVQKKNNNKKLGLQLEEVSERTNSVRLILQIISINQDADASAAEAKTTAVPAVNEKHVVSLFVAKLLKCKFLYKLVI